VYNLVQCCAWLLLGDGPVSEGFSLRQHGHFFGKLVDHTSILVPDECCPAHLKGFQL
jgi:hypothetical protein